MEFTLLQIKLIMVNNEHNNRWNKYQRNISDLVIEQNFVEKEN